MNEKKVKRTKNFSALLLLVIIVFSFAAPIAVRAETQAATDASSCPPGWTYQTLSNGTDQLSGSCTNDATGQVSLVNTELPASPVQPTQCNASMTNWGPIFNPICWGRFLGSLVGGLMVSIASWFLTLAGVLFNWTLNVTVVQFGQFMTDSVLQGITTAWTAFRDIANIVIIGMFTFIAISIIIGLKEYGQKKLIARVLIIAVLINFSLLFSKIIIDASNFTAGQFYNAALNQVAGGSAINSTNQSGVNFCTKGSSNSQCYGIAGAFMDYAGVSGFGDTRAAVSALADRLDDGYLSLLFAVFTSILFIGAALILFYGTFLLISRAILFIFLMAISAMAFASYLVPVWDKSNYGWGAWWGSILKNALLAPLLMLFLWMTLNIANAMRAGPGGGTLGDLLTNPTKAVNLTALLNYIIVFGMLFTSFKLASKLSEKVGGFSWASMATALPLTLGSRLAGFGLRQTAGWAGYASQKDLQGQAREARDRATQSRVLQAQALQNKQFGRANRLGSIATNFDKLAAEKLTGASRSGALGDSKFNLMNTAGAKSVLKTLGVTGFAAGESSKGAKSYSDRVKADAEAAEKKARAIAVSGDDEKKLGQGVRERRREVREAKQLQKEGTQKIQEAIRDAGKGEREAVEASMKDARAQAAESAKRHDEDLKGLAEKMTTGAAAPAQLEALKTKRDLELKSEATKIREANEKIQELDKKKYSVTVDGKNIESSVEETKSAINKFNEEISEHADDSEETRAIIKQTIDRAKESAQEAAGKVEYGAIRSSAQREYVAKEVRNKFKTNVSSASIRHALEEYVKKEEGGGSAEKATESGEKH